MNQLAVLAPTTQTPLAGRFKLGSQSLGRSQAYHRYPLLQPPTRVPVPQILLGSSMVYLTDEVAVARFPTEHMEDIYKLFSDRLWDQDTSLLSGIGMERWRKGPCIRIGESDVKVHYRPESLPGVACIGFLEKAKVVRLVEDCYRQVGRGTPMIFLGVTGGPSGKNYAFECVRRVAGEFSDVEFLARNGRGDIVPAGDPGWPPVVMRLPTACICLEDQLPVTQQPDLRHVRSLPNLHVPFLTTVGSRILRMFGRSPKQQVKGSHHDQRR